MVFHHGPDAGIAQGGGAQLAETEAVAGPTLDQADTGQGEQQTLRTACRHTQARGDLGHREGSVEQLLEQTQADPGKQDLGIDETRGERVQLLCATQGYAAYERYSCGAGLERGAGQQAIPPAVDGVQPMSANGRSGGFPGHCGRY